MAEKLTEEEIEQLEEAVNDLAKWNELCVVIIGMHISNF